MLASTSKSLSSAATDPRSMDEVWKDMSLDAADLHPCQQSTLLPLSIHPHAVPIAFYDHDADGWEKRQPEHEGSSSDRRNKRMMKNRESAARSRARKQAYTYELELEVAQLKEQIGRLKTQLQLLQLLSDAAAAADQHQKRKPLSRTSTAPF